MKTLIGVKTHAPRLCGEGWFWDGVLCARAQHVGPSTTTTPFPGSFNSALRVPPPLRPLQYGAAV